MSVTAETSADTLSSLANKPDECMNVESGYKCDCETAENGATETVQAVPALKRKKTARKKSTASASSAMAYRADLCELQVPPLDFSYYDMQSVLQVVPVYISMCRTQSKGRNSVKLRSKSQLENEEEAEEKTGPKSKTRCVRLNNNKLNSTFGLDLVIQRILLDITKLTWLDLSSNDLTLIEDSLVACGNLESLYLHSNRIFDVNEVKKLAQLAKLRRLTLYGNPVEKHRSSRVSISSSIGCSFRVTIVAFMPQLLSLDLNTITAEDRNRAANWQRLHHTKPARTGFDNGIALAQSSSTS